MIIKTFQTLAYCLILTVTILGLTSCGTPSIVKNQQNTELKKAEKFEQGGQYSLAAQEYWTLAQTLSSPDKERLQIKAAEMAVLSGNFTAANNYQENIDESLLSVDLVTRKRLVNAAIARHSENYQQILEILPESLITSSPRYRAIILDYRALAQAATGDTLASINSRIQRHDFLSQRSDINENQNQIWLSLSSATNEQLNLWSDTDNIQLAGWIALAQTKKLRYTNADQLAQALSQWRRNYPSHPASNNLLISIQESFENYFSIPTKIALLLPMSGKFSKIAEVIYAGILSARELNDSQEYRPELVLYDTGDDPNSITVIYNRAVNDGADFIIGPLKKQAVENLALQGNLTVPVLTLNYLSDPSQQVSNLFQFGLLPEDESRQVAERASLDTHDQAIVLAPRNEWGVRLTTAFESRFQELNGSILNSQFYSQQNTDFSEPLKTALLLNESEQRYQKLRATLGTNLEFQPRRRQDVDMIFLIATPQAARLIRPQINYYFANNLPVYSTSHIYSGIENSFQDRDINGVIYCDIPWLLQPSHKQELLRELLEIETGDAYKLLPRFAALGVDAYSLPEKLGELSALNHDRYHGLTGKLSLQENNRIYRELNWAKFNDGRARILNGE